ncbi:DUF6286 domain-containing protein [Catellatospora vulcania]|uniref:DUF6286 domain-containing protein n=1 Tax=Catellatospora vulcania TaxID=1460450 RepID=UPI0012D3C703|nr:DUF6286 domain-containing protein [Catellatospora vulcania]
MRRVVNRLLALAVSLALIAFAALVLIEIIAALLGRAPLLVDWPAATRWAQGTTWGDSQPLAISLLLLAVGAALVIGQLWPGGLTRLAVDRADPDTDVAVSRRSVAQDVTDAVRQVDGVVPQRVKVGRTRIAVRAAAPATDDRSALTDDVKTAIVQRLERLHLRRPPRLAVKLSRRA